MAGNIPHAMLWRDQAGLIRGDEKQNKNDRQADANLQRFEKSRRIAVVPGEKEQARPETGYDCCQQYEYYEFHPLLSFSLPRSIA